jgi:hypothetical protein
MTISSTALRSSTAGNGTTTAFTFPYLFFAEDDLTVILVVDSTNVETTQTITTHYTVTGEGVAAGGTVTMVTAPAVGETLVVLRNEQFTQGLDLVENDPFPSDLVEKQFDILTMLTQRLKDLSDRSVKLSDGDTSGADLTLALPTANTVLQWDAAGTAMKVGPTATDVSAAATNATNAATSATAAAASATTAAASATTALAAKITISTASPSGGVDGDIWFKVST